MRGGTPAVTLDGLGSDTGTLQELRNQRETLAKQQVLKLRPGELTGAQEVNGRGPCLPSFGSGEDLAAGTCGEVCTHTLASDTLTATQKGFLLSQSGSPRLAMNDWHEPHQGGQVTSRAALNSPHPLLLPPHPIVC